MHTSGMEERSGSSDGTSPWKMGRGRAISRPPCFATGVLYLSTVFISGIPMQTRQLCVCMCEYPGSLLFGGVVIFHTSICGDFHSCRIRTYPFLGTHWIRSVLSSGSKGTGLRTSAPHLLIEPQTNGHCCCTHMDMPATSESSV